jgi:6-phosphogluconate dehydrogenase
MKIGIIGLGKMGYNIALNLANHGHHVFAYDKDATLASKLTNENINCQKVNEIADFKQILSKKRIIWLMVPAGDIVEGVIYQLTKLLSKGDIIIDGGNSNFKDSKRRCTTLLEKGIHLLDCGTSGGTSGALHGACTMIGGDEAAYTYCKPIFEDISLPKGSLYAGESGAGHFVKMVHNGIEYGMMQSIAEGFEVLEKSSYNIDYQSVALLWQQGSVVRSWLMELTANAFAKDPNLDSIKGIMHSSGEGKWTLETALDLGVPTPVIALSVMMRYRSLQEDTFSGRVVAALRNEFGGHAVEKKNSVS